MRQCPRNCVCVRGVSLTRSLSSGSCTCNPSSDAGAKPPLWFGLQAVIEAGDAVIYPDPGFPSYKNSIIAFGGVPRPVPLNEAGSSFDMDALRAALEPRQDFLMESKARVILMNSPSNPTGGVMGDDELQAIAELAIEHDCIVISDEIYSKLVYGGGQKPGGILEIPGMRERSIVVDGFSKTFCMTVRQLTVNLARMRCFRSRSSERNMHEAKL